MMMIETLRICMIKFCSFWSLVSNNPLLLLFIPLFFGDNNSNSNSNNNNSFPRKSKQASIFFFSFSLSFPISHGSLYRARTVYRFLGCCKLMLDFFFFFFFFCSFVFLRLLLQSHVQHFFSWFGLVQLFLLSPVLSSTTMVK